MTLYDAAWFVGICALATILGFVAGRRREPDDPDADVILSTALGVLGPVDGREQYEDAH
ncbi:hypothetical protein QSJ18_18380 [Gordonia sp. ABSL1-1]|uniref:hypothetical protein n=1 Tax=Gordonia sp. ABSL1-1 TaxID=3053923 RepID=UPI0025734E4B|nr:hypothetical protein [Gordonia sp. ABSL1-1]MDL9938718.1 hypothetical protein [Gordonia sp. ABSL1-1]